MKILHVCKLDKFIPPFVDLVHEEFGFESQHWWVSGNFKDFPITLSHPHLYRVEKHRKYSIPTLLQQLNLIVKLHKADKIILHGLFNNRQVKMFWWMPWLLKKCYWVIWGDDLYRFRSEHKKKRWRKKEFYRRGVIKNIGNLVTYIPGDVELTRAWYGAKGRYVECFMYPSNLYKELEMPSKKESTITILVGNSADPSNNHEEILERLAVFKNKNIMVIAPLSYGKKDNVDKVVRVGRKLLGERFTPLTDFLPFNEYLKVLTEVDVAVFNHNRQQAMGNIISLLGLGKKVYLRSDVAQWQLFQDLNIEVHDVSQLESTLFNLDNLPNLGNKEKIKNHFSKSNLIKQLESLFQ